ncbi:MAG: hypothetical protein D6682_07775 [Zetaproteobacteria bacterium]|nr:MAG: hypothetical protein D6682_07775 [Zetaproteobacteria bacterium]
MIAVEQQAHGGTRCDLSMIATWEPDGALLLADGAGRRRVLPVEAWRDGVPLPEQDGGEEGAARVVLLPIERLLVRPLRLPLAHPRFVDGAVVGQELEDQAGIDAEAWWPAWQVVRHREEGVTGLVLAMPEAMRAAIAGHPFWSHASSVGCDGWVRLAAQRLTAGRDDATGEGDEVQPWLDADDDGIFFGCWQGEGCLGLRRLNRCGGAIAHDALAGQVVRSLRAMGWEGAAARGRIDTAWRDALAAAGLDGTPDGVDRLPGRLDANVEAFSAVGGVGIEFRYGRWAPPSSALARWRIWRRPLALAALALLVWYGRVEWAIAGYERQAAALEERIAQAFHRGLPDQTVMLDPLAQLQAAARGLSDAPGRDRLLRSLAALARVHARMGWKMRSLRLERGGFSMRGSVADLERLNRLRDMLARELGRPVTIEDTDLGKRQVAFRLRW